jgi:hypothetical protein
METIYWYFCPNGNYIFGVLGHFVVENYCGKEGGFAQFPNESYIFFHNFRMETTYFSTASKSKLYIFPQLPNGNYI